MSLNPKQVAANNITESPEIPNSIVRVWSLNETFFFRWFDATSDIPLNYQNEGHGWDW